MAEGVFAGLATEGVKTLAQLVAARASEQIDRSLHFKDHLRQIKSKVMDIQAFLEDASKSQDAHRSEWLKLWVQRVKNVAYDAEDVMDEYAFEICRRKMELKDQCFDKVRDFFTLSSPLLFHFRMTQKVHKILSSFKELEQTARANGLTGQMIAAAMPMPSSYSFVDNLSESREYAAANPSDFVGRVDDIEKLLKNICDPKIEQDRISTLAIVGMGGVGKTTLARSLYDHAKIRDHFSEKLWVFVSPKFSIKGILNGMIESLTSSKPGLTNEDAITTNLQQKLKGKKFLLVLDDVWNTHQESWDPLSESLRRIGGLPGSVILITTRENDVAGAARSFFKHKLKELSDDESWSLFVQKVSIDGTSINQSKEEIGRRIVKKCSGIPLAIKVIGGLLQSKQHPHEWESIEKSKLWDLPQGRNQILPSLMLSFIHLPTPSLKQCFACLSIFPKNRYRRYVCKTELIGVWSSQGYLRVYNQSHRTPMDIGEDYIKMLLNSSLLQESKYDDDDVYMHDLVYDLAFYVSRDDLINEPKDQEEGSCRHLVFNHKKDKTTSDFPPREVLLKLRIIGLTGNVPWYTLTDNNVSSNNVPWDKLIQARYLRMLFLNRNNITELSSEIGSLKHLRYLDLSDNPIETLPDSFGKLYQLETLVLKGCTGLKILPKVIYRLVNLRYIWTTTPMIACKGLTQMTHLEALPCLELKANGEGWTIDELGKLDNLRDEISIHGLEHVKDKEEARKAGLARKAKVTKLTLTWAEARDFDGVSDEDILNGLEPHPNITSLKLVNFYGEKLPSWILTMATKKQRDNKIQLSNLNELELVNCKRCRTLPALGQLPYLKDLVLDGFDVDCIGREFYCDENLTAIVVSFPCLKNLGISNFQRLTTWMDPPQEAFPCLESLLISKCPILESVPALLFNSLMRRFDISDCASLKKIPSSLEECTSLEFLSIQTIPIIEVPLRNFSRKLQPSNLTEVRLVNCKRCRTLPPLGRLPNLKDLVLIGLDVDCIGKEFYGDEDLTAIVVSFPCLKNLEITNFQRLTTWMDPPQEAFTRLEIFGIYKCSLLESVPASLANSLMRYFVISDCGSLRKIPSSLEECTSLELLRIQKIPIIEGPPMNFSKLQRLWELMVCCYSAKDLRSMIKSVQHLPDLYRLGIGGYKDEEEMRDYFSDITPYKQIQSLNFLTLIGCPNMKTLPQQPGLLTLTQIVSLEICDFEDLEEIPDWICNFSSLGSLRLEGCKNLKCIPSRQVLQRLPKLSYLLIVICPLLAERYAKDKGPEWHNISDTTHLVVVK